ncbi:MAG TPA: choice-of-anchor tandem repeat GloVer-containing protein, partial [Terracidiphilus sp.]|nr:choice-of-anchor tandem repeat GloVer-containing protein [Terracidiphilus sp.]
LYGTAAGSTLGLCTGCGSVFQLAPPTTPGGPWTETVLHLFTGGNYTEDGTVPDSTPVLGPNGVLYGTTYGGGIYDWGTIYELLPPSSPGGAWTEVILYSFTDGPDGGEPMGVALGPDGNLYGTTQVGGVSPHGILNQGTVFELVLPQNANNR